MSGLNYKDQLMAEIYRQERMREAETERLVRYTVPQGPKRSKLLSTSLNWLGGQFIAWGTRLQEKQHPLDRQPGNIKLSYYR